MPHRLLTRKAVRMILDTEDNSGEEARIYSAHYRKLARIAKIMRIIGCIGLGLTGVCMLLVHIMR